MSSRELKRVSAAVRRKVRREVAGSFPPFDVFLVQAMFPEVSIPVHFGRADEDVPEDLVHIDGVERRDHRIVSEYIRRVWSK
jgi:hypothetical protein